MGVLIGVFVLVGIIGSYFEVRRSSVESASARVRDVETQLQTMLAGNFSNRAAQLGSFADTATVLRDVLRGAPTDSGAVARALNAIRQRTDSTLPIDLWDTRGRRIAQTGVAIPALGDTPPSETAFGDTAGARIGPLMIDNGRVLYHLDIPIQHEGRPLGLIRQTKRVSGAGAARAIETLVGAGRMYVTNESGDVWITLNGEMASQQPIQKLGETYETTRDGKRVLAYGVLIPGSRWVSMIEMPMDTILARPQAFLRRAILIGTALGMLGVLLAWLLSRRMTAPIRDLNAAAASFAAGAYDARVAVTTSDEIGRLANTFNEMADQVQTAHGELAQRYDEAASLATQLELSNEQLEAAVDVAETARVEAQEASKAKSDFLATMSHEIRTPVNAMVGYTDLLDMGLPGELTEMQTRYVTRIRESGRHLVGLVDELLDFAKIEAHEVRVDPAPHAARPALDAAVQALQGAATRKGVRLTAMCRDDYYFRGDQRRVHQILLNLVNNAIKFTEKGGSVTVACGRGAPPAELVAEELHDAICFTVQDTGIGIADDQLTRIFQPFVQVAGGYTRQHGGTGLGLSISQKLALLMGGAIQVESEPGVGSTFTLWLPGSP